MRRRKETALEEQQSFCFKEPCSFLLRCTQGIRYLRTDQLLINCMCVCVCVSKVFFNILYSPEHQLQHDIFTEEADQSPEQSQRDCSQLRDTRSSRCFETLITTQRTVSKCVT